MSAVAPTATVPLPMAAVGVREPYAVVVPYWK
jgi:hypothetical protein